MPSSSVLPRKGLSGTPAYSSPVPGVVPSNAASSSSFAPRQKHPERNLLLQIDPPIALFGLASHLGSVEVYIIRHLFVPSGHFFSLHFLAAWSILSLRLLAFAVSASSSSSPTPTIST